MPRLWLGRGPVPYPSRPFPHLRSIGGARQSGRDDGCPPPFGGSKGVPALRRGGQDQGLSGLCLRCPLPESTRHIIDAHAIAQMKKGVTLLNTSRGGPIDTTAVIGGLKSGRVGDLGIDVYEEEDNLFFEDQSGKAMQDDVFAPLLTFPNVLITGHQAFLGSNALTQIARRSLQNLSELEKNGTSANEIELTNG